MSVDDSMENGSRAPEEGEGARGQPPVAEAVAPDPVRATRLVKWLTRLFVYPGVTALIPLDHFLLNLSWQQAVSVHLGGYVIATIAIEAAFAQMFRLRKQSSYPGVLLLQLGQVDSAPAAYQSGLTVLGQLLNLSGSFLCVFQSGSLTVAAVNGISRFQVDQFLKLGAADIQKTIDSCGTVRFRPRPDLMSSALLQGGIVLVFAPVRSLQRTTGVLGLLAKASNKDLKDERLLDSMGLALGLLLENLRQKEELRHMAAMDELTGVYNRRYFFDELRREIALASRHASPLSVALVDLDGLKAINDTLGHAAGDELLRSVALRLVRYSRASDLVARIGGDEFALILPQTDSRAARQLAARLQHEVGREPVPMPGGHKVKTAISCGIASFPEDGGDSEALLQRADAAMYSVKTSRRQTARA